VPFDTAVAIAREILSSQGFGCGELIATSGEVGVFELLAGADSPLVFDVGGHVGEYTAAFLRRFPGGRAFVFEPSATHFSILSKRFGDRQNVQAFRIALGAASGEASLYKDAEVTGLASLTRRRLDHFGLTMDKEERVQVSTLDEQRAKARIEFIDLLKIDVEGNELDVLKGATQALDEAAIAAVQFEFGGCNLDTRTNLQDFFYFFAQYRYRLHIVQPGGNLFPLKKYDEMYEQYRTTNYAALPERGRGYDGR